MHRNTIIAICAGFCAVAVIAGLFVASLSSSSKPITVVLTTPGAEGPTATSDAGPAADLPTGIPQPTPEATEPPISTQEEPTTAATAAPEPTSAPTSAPAPTAAPEPTSAPTSAPAPTATTGQFIEYTVQRGDELLALAKKYNVTAKEILANNQIANPDSLVVGQVLRIPKK